MPLTVHVFEILHIILSLDLCGMRQKAAVETKTQGKRCAYACLCWARLDDATVVKIKGESHC